MKVNLLKEDMDNREIYKKTLTFSLRRFAWDIMSLIVITILTAIGFSIADKTISNGLIGLCVG